MNIALNDMHIVQYDFMKLVFDNIKIIVFNSISWLKS